MNANSLERMVIPLKFKEQFANFVQQVNKSKLHCLYIKKSVRMTLTDE